MINALIIIVLLAIILILLTGVRLKGIIALTTVLAMGSISIFTALKSLNGPAWETVLNGTYLFGEVPVRIDSLSAWFILLINFTIITGAVYGFSYMKAHIGRKSDITLHSIAFLLVQFSLTAICVIQNTFIFLLFWEIMALSVFILVIFDHHKPETIKAGINYLVQSHVSIVFLMLGFIFIAIKTGGYSFDSISSYTHSHSSLAGSLLFLVLFTGFAIKAGFVPFHTWLPYAHPAAPSHVSGIMSGVVIKIGIYGILRMLLVIKTDYVTIGYIILSISVISGLYGVMLAIVQHNLKRLLAYHSIENIGIIGIGIGLGCIGLGTMNKMMTILGFSGALLHTLNHSLFKSVLFYSAGNVLQTTGTVNIERLGGLIKKMRASSVLFLISAIAICGLPPLNGFISEFLILGGFYNWLLTADLLSLISIVFSVGALVLIGGLAILCFTKAYSIVFLGTGRDRTLPEATEVPVLQLLPMYLATLLMILIGLFPSFFTGALNDTVNLFTLNAGFNPDLPQVNTPASLASINWLFVGLIALISVLLLIRKRSEKKKVIERGSTWGCGYESPAERTQYTASSFVRSYAKLAKPVLDIEKKEGELNEVFPGKSQYETHPYDKIERVFIDKPLKLLNSFTDQFRFLQNGRLQFYILYGIIFVAAVITIPLLIDKISAILNFLKTM